MISSHQSDLENSSTTSNEPLISSIINNVTTTDPEKEYTGLLSLRKHLKDESPMPIQEIIDSGVVPPLIRLMKPPSELKIRIEATWCLMNLCYGSLEQIQTLVEYGIFPGFVSALTSQNDELIEHSMEGLSIIAGESTEFRDMILQYTEVPIIEVILEILKNTTKESIRKSVVWVFQSFCSRKPFPAFHLVKKTVPVFWDYLKKGTDEEVFGVAAVGIFFVSGTKEGIEFIVASDMSGYLVELLSVESARLNCLGIIGNILGGTEEQVSVMLKEKELIPKLLELAQGSDKNTYKPVYKAVLNITKGSAARVEIIMGNPAFVEKLVKVVRSDPRDTGREALSALVNSTRNIFIPAQGIRLLESGVFGCFVGLLKNPDVKLLLEVLGGIENCLKSGKELELNDEEGMDRFMVELKKTGGLDQIKALAKHKNQKVREKVEKMIENCQLMIP